MRKSKESATIILCLGIFLLLPPVTLIFNKSVSMFGVPLIAVYLFSVWLLLIGLSAWIARRMPMKTDRDA